MSQSTFKRKAHIAYFQRCLSALPAQAQGHDSNRITIAYFCLSGLALLNALAEDNIRKQREEWIEWVWTLQAPTGGFRGSTYLTPATSPDTGGSTYNPAHLPSTYTAILVLALLRADMSRLDVDGLYAFLGSCQEKDGSFSPLPVAAEEVGRPPSFQSDARMAYCANAVSSVVPQSSKRSSGKQLSPFDRDRLESWIRSCQTWEGGYGARPGLEAQGGTSYCCIASLRLLGCSSSEEERSAAMRYLSHRQVIYGNGGFQGRPGKDEDVCYSFWCGAGLRLLGADVMFDQAANTRALLDSQSPIGGFGKTQGDFPDPFHSYLAIAAFAMLDNDAGEAAERMSSDHPSKLGLLKLDPGWNVDVVTKEWLVAEVARHVDQNDDRYIV